MRRRPGEAQLPGHRNAPRGAAPGAARWPARGFGDASHTHRPRTAPYFDPLATRGIFSTNWIDEDHDLFTAALVRHQHREKNLRGQHICGMARGRAVVRLALLCLCVSLLGHGVWGAATPAGAKGGPPSAGDEPAEYEPSTVRLDDEDDDGSERHYVQEVRKIVPPSPNLSTPPPTLPCTRADGTCDVLTISHPGDWERGSGRGAAARGGEGLLPHPRPRWRRILE